MSITPIELRKAEFKKSMMGYNTDEVEALLASAADTLEELRREVSGLKERNKGLDEKLESYQGLERTLNETLIMAQKASDSSRQNAERESDLIISQAEIQAEKLVGKAKSRLLELNVEIEELEHQKHAYLMRLRSLVASQWKMLQEEETEEEKFKNEIKRVRETEDAALRQKGTETEEAISPEEPPQAGDESMLEEQENVEEQEKDEDSGDEINAESISEEFGRMLGQVTDESVNEPDTEEKTENDESDLDDTPKLFWGEDEDGDEPREDDNK